jgi:predicted peptidase
MCWIPVLIGGMILTIGLISASKASAESWQDLLESKKFESVNGRSMPYRLLKPETIEPGVSYPLVLFLHGIGERGTNNSKQLTHGIVAFTKQENRQKYPCFVVAPQCPVEDSWVPLISLLLWQSMRDKSTPALKVALELVDKLAIDLPVDPQRIYITGLSMGGFGVWEAISRRPDFFAAAIPICGGGDSNQASKLKGLPIWAFHGNIDVTVPTSRTLTMVEAVRRAGGHPKLTIYPGVGHMCWNQAYGDPETFAWFFAQKK